ncbi:hypothetical protein Aau02nite_86410 [Amorphoplanes auranticolor]|uniref:Uncharacterized protein n=1 Tax=Actinoplanes auranticolor TaxID=47988 RepID=A0A919W4N5_9ACTN|nr:hypothetical protein Aau02nite_86410 [Actinoplanes auranticolor]
MTIDPQLSLVSLRNEIRGLGHTAPSSAAVVLTDARIIADRADSPSLHALRTCVNGGLELSQTAVDTLG